MTPKERAAMQQALEALEYLNDYDEKPLLLPEAITALREALAEQAEQEPVAWKDMAFARLGVVRDKMQPEDVAVVQRFLDGDYAANVRTKDLTDDEIDEIFVEHGTIPNTKAVRSVIASDRSKNGII